MSTRSFLLLLLLLTFPMQGCIATSNDDDSAAADDDDATSDDDDATSDDDDATGDDDDSAPGDDDDSAPGDDDDSAPGDDDDSAPGDDDDSAPGDDDDSAPGDDDDSAPDPLDVDNDGDGVTENEGDCDDGDINNFPGNIENCFDGSDNDCDTVVDRAELGSQYLEVDSGYATWAGNSGFTYSTGLTFEAFVKINTGSTSADNRILWHQGSDYAILDLYASGSLAPQYAPQLELNVGGASGTTTSQTAASTGTWTHVAAAFDVTSGIVDYYIDGTLIGTYTTTTLTGFSPDGSIYIGGQNALTSVMDVDDIRSWNVYRTEAEIQASLCDTVAPNEPGLLFNFTFEGVDLDGANAASPTANQTATSVSLQPHVF